MKIQMNIWILTFHNNDLTNGVKFLNNNLYNNIWFNYDYTKPNNVLHLGLALNSTDSSFYPKYSHLFFIFSIYGIEFCGKKHSDESYETIWQIKKS